MGCLSFPELIGESRERNWIFRSSRKMTIIGTEFAMNKKATFIKKGSVLVVGGGIGGMQAALDLADSGFKVHMVQKDSSIGGTMVMLDKTFPTGDCSMCMISPKMVELGRHKDIHLHTLATVKSVDGEPGNFTVKVRQEARYVDPV